MNFSQSGKRAAVVLPSMVLLAASFAAAQPAAPAHHAAAGSADEAKTAAVLEGLRKDPGALRAFLYRMPKGGDLHVHLTGAVYAETFIAEAASDGFCVDTARLAYVPNHGTTKSIPAEPVCAEGQVPASAAFKDQKLYDALIDSFSMRAFVPSAGVSGHDQFFATFGRFGLVPTAHSADWTEEVMLRAAAQNEQYLELMATPHADKPTPLGPLPAWNGDDLPAMRQAYLDAGLRTQVSEARAQMERQQTKRMALEHCGTPQAAPSCRVDVRLIYQALRAAEPQRLFQQALMGYEMANVEPHVVGLNFVQPEDGYVSMKEYGELMKILQYLHGAYPKVHLTLHAGELAAGLVPPDGTTFHIREAVEMAGAERVGHGVDVMYEKDAEGLLKEMAAKHVDVEVNLTSNDVILGVKGAEHPLHDYIRAGVPFSLSTDDEGVSRIDITNEYKRAVLEQGLTYRQLKQAARTSIEHSFLPGDSLWAKADDFSARRKECTAWSDAPTGACGDWLKTSEKAQQQWELERRFRAFEAEVAKAPMPGAAK